VIDDNLDECRTSPCVEFPSRRLSPAKLNLGLSVLGQRNDGYHFIQSLFWPIQFCDEIEFVSGPARVKMQWAEDAPLRSQTFPLQHHNLAFLAMESQPAGFEILIQKRIPLGAGLGGGSSNAGTTLRYLMQSGTLNNDESRRISARLGADVSYFLNPVPAWVSGIGDICKPITFAPKTLETLHFLLILLPIACNTKDVFDSYRRQNTRFSDPGPSPPPAMTRTEVTQYLTASKNDLEPLVCEQYPLMSKVLNALRSMPALYAGLSGTGSTCFAVFDSDDSLEESFKALANFCREYHCKGVKAVTFCDDHSAPRRTSWKSLR